MSGWDPYEAVLEAIDAGDLERALPYAVVLIADRLAALTERIDALEQAVREQPVCERRAA